PRRPRVRTRRRPPAPLLPPHYGSPLPSSHADADRCARSAPPRRSPEALGCRFPGFRGPGPRIRGPRSRNRPRPGVPRRRPRSVRGRPPCRCRRHNFPWSLFPLPSTGPVAANGPAYTGRWGETVSGGANESKGRPCPHTRTRSWQAPRDRGQPAGNLSRTDTVLPAAEALRPPQAQGTQGRFERHRTVELALTHNTVLEVDGDLHQLLSPPISPIVHLHLKGVPGAFDTGQIQHVQCRGPPDLEARGHITHGHGQHGLYIGVGPAAEKPSAQSPLIGEATAGNVTTTDDHTGVGGVQSAQQLGNIAHGVAEVGVHLHDVVGPVRQSSGHTLDV